MTIISPNKDVEGRLSDIVHKEHDWFWRHEGSENLLAYIALVASGSGLSAESATEDKVLDAIASSPVSEGFREHLEKLISEGSVGFVRSLMRSFSADELRDIVLHHDPKSFRTSTTVYTTDPSKPSSLRELGARLLNLEPDDCLADFNCGDGAFLVNAVEKYSVSSVYFHDIWPDKSCLAEARLRLLGIDCPLDNAFIFSDEHLRSFDKIFDAPPLVRVSFLSGAKTPYLKPILDGSDPMGRPSSADWLYCRLAYDSLREGGTAVVIITNGATINGGDANARRYFVENGMVRASVALPAKLSPDSNVNFTLLVLGKNNGPIRLVDATDLGTPGRRTNTLSDGAISEIEARLSHDGDMSRLASRKEFAARDYSLYAPRYLGKGPELVNPTHLGDLTVSIERGASIRAADLDELSTQENTGLYFLRLADISDGSFSDDLQRLKSVDLSSERQWLRSGDLVLSKSGAPFKVAVADVPDGSTVLASGNLYIIRLDTERVDPYFVAAFLASEDGKRSLECMVVGTTIPSLPLRNLRNVQVPVPDMDTQRRVAATYRANLDQIAVLKIRLDSARAALSDSYDEEMGR